DRSKDRKLEPRPIPKLASVARLNVGEPSVYDTDHRGQDVEDVTLDHVTEVDQEQRGTGELLAEAFVDVSKDRDNFHQQEDRDTNRDDRDRGRIHHRRLHLFAQTRGVFQVSREAGQNFSEQTAAFAGGHHTNVKARKNFGMLLQRLGKAVAAFNARADVLDDIAHDLVGRLLGEGLQ